MIQPSKCVVAALLPVAALSLAAVGVAAQSPAPGAAKKPAAAAKPAATPAPWWSPDWAYRRTLTVGDGFRGARPAQDVAVAEVPTLGQSKPDGSDFRLIDAEGHGVPVEVLAGGFEDRALIAFTAAPHAALTLYFGNPAASVPAKVGPFPVGLLLEVHELGEGDPKSWPAMRQLLDRSPRVTGRWAVPGLSIGFNPLGAWDRGIFVFTGWLQCPADGTYTFATNAFDASFVLVDGTPVAEWPGWHPPFGGQAGGHQGRVELKAGAHRLTYVNAFRGHGACAVGWQKPGDARVGPIPPDAFAGAWIARPGPAEARAGATADFTWAFDDDLGIEGRKVTAVSFTALSRGKRYLWNFGDGVTASEASPQHVYLEAGTFEVSLDVDGRAARQKVRVQPARGHLGRAYERRVAGYAGRIRDYPVEGLSAGACFEMGQICHEAGLLDPAARAFQAAFQKGFVPQGADEERWLPRLCDLLRDRGKPADAVAVCDRILQARTSGTLAVRALVLKAAALYDDLDRRDEADVCCRTVLEKHKTAATDYVRLAVIRHGELTLAGGDREGARKILEEVERAPAWRRRTGDFEVSEGAHAITFEERLRDLDTEAALQEVASWEWDRPTVLLTGQTRHLRGRVLLARKRYEPAAREFDRALAADPQASFADEALFWKAQALDALQRKDQARECYETIVRAFPESQLAAQARERLK